MIIDLTLLELMDFSPSKNCWRSQTMEESIGEYNLDKQALMLQFGALGLI